MLAYATCIEVEQQLLDCVLEVRDHLRLEHRSAYVSILQHTSAYVLEVRDHRHVDSPSARPLLSLPLLLLLLRALRRLH
jgi:hypothetical protein